MCDACVMLQAYAGDPDVEEEKKRRRALFPPLERNPRWGFCPLPPPCAPRLRAPGEAAGQVWPWGGAGGRWSSPSLGLSLPRPLGPWGLDSGASGPVRFCFRACGGGVGRPLAASDGAAKLGSLHPIGQGSWAWLPTGFSGVSRRGHAVGIDLAQLAGQGPEREGRPGPGDL